MRRTLYYDSNMLYIEFEAIISSLSPRSMYQKYYSRLFNNKTILNLGKEIIKIHENNNELYIQSILQITNVFVTYVYEKINSYNIIIAATNSQ